MRVRGLLAALGVLGAIFATAVAVPALWAERNIIDESGYVELVSPLAADSDFQGELSNVLGDQLTRNLDAPAPVREAVQLVIEKVAAKVAELEGYQAAWDKSQRRTHRLLLDSSAADKTRGIDIGPLGELVIARVNELSPLALEAPESIVVPVDRVDPHVVQTLRELPLKAYAASVLAVLLALGSLAAARSRARALAWLGFGLVLVAGALKVAVDEVAPTALQTGELSARLQEIVIGTVTASFDGWLLVLGAVGVLAAVAGFALGLFSGGGGAVNSGRP